MNWLKSILARVLNRHPATEYSTTRSWINYGYQDARKDLTAGDRKELQRLSRFFEAGSAIVNRMADLWECYVVGPNGLQIFPASSSPEWNARALAQWNAWKPFADISSRDGWDVLQSRIARNWFIDGEVFVLLTREGNFPRVQILEAHRCFSPDGAADNVVDGVELDPNGRPIAYWFQTSEKRMSRLDASFVIHIFEPSRIGQVRGVPLISPVLNDIRDLDDLQILEMRASKHAARIGIIQKNKAGEVATREMVRSRFTTANTSPTGADTTQTRANYYQSSVGSDVVVLQNGDEIAQFMANRPTENTRALWRELKEKICVGTGFVYAVVFPDSMQGTVYRGALDMMNAFFRSRSNSLANQFQRVFEWVIGNDTTLISGRPTDWRGTSVRPPRAVNVDVGRNSAAMVQELQSGLRTYQDIYAEVGDDWRQKLAQRAEEASYLKSLAKAKGLTVDDIVGDGDKGFPEEYGVAVRAGVLTPNADDEKFLREKFGLPPMNESVVAAWEDSEGVRFPITLAQETVTQAPNATQSQSEESNQEETQDTVA